MTRNIPKNKWKKFFDELSKRRYQWFVNVEIINPDIGDQILDRRLPLVGITAEERGERSIIEISVGDSADQHQSHSVVNPKEVAYLSNENDDGGTVEILEDDGTKTLIQLLGPMPIAIDYANDQEIAAA